MIINVAIANIVLKNWYFPVRLQINK